MRYKINLNRYVLGGAKILNRNMPEQKISEVLYTSKIWAWLAHKVLGAGMVSSDSTMCVVVTKDWVNCG